MAATTNLVVPLETAIEAPVPSPMPQTDSEIMLYIRNLLEAKLTDRRHVQSIIADLPVHLDPVVQQSLRSRLTMLDVVVDSLMTLWHMYYKEVTGEPYIPYGTAPGQLQHEPRVVV